MLDRFAWLVDGLVVLPERMRANLDASHGLFFSQRVLLALVESRAAARRGLPARPGARAARLGRGARLPRRSSRATSGSPAASTSTAAFDLGAYTRHVDTVFDRLHALPPKEAAPCLRPLVHVASGKVRELFTIDDERLLLVASDRISTFDVVLPTEIPDKGRVLTGLSAFWFARTRDIVPNHLLALRPDGRSTECRRLEMLPLECVVRGYLAGSGWKDYQRDRLDVRARAARGAARVGPAAGADLHAVDEGDDRPRREHRRASRRPALVGERALRRGRAHLARALPLRRPSTPRRAGSCSPTRSSSSGSTPTGGSSSATRRSRPTRRASGRPTSTSPAARSRRSTSSSSATTASRSAGTRPPPGPELPEDVVAGTRARYVEAFERLTGIAFDDYLADPAVVLA